MTINKFINRLDGIFIKSINGLIKVANNTPPPPASHPKPFVCSLLVLLSYSIFSNVSLETSINSLSNIQFNIGSKYVT